MKVIHIACGNTPIQPTGAGGVQKDLYFLTKYLSQLDCNAGVIDISPEVHRKLQTGAKIHTVWNPPISGEFCGTRSHIIKVCIFSILAAFRLYWLLKEDKIDIIHTHGQFPGAAILVFKWLLGWSHAIVHTIHSSHILMNPTKVNKLKYFLEVIVLNKVDLVITETETGRRQLESVFNIKPEKIAVVPQGLNLTEINDFVEKNRVDAREDKGHVVLYVGRVCPRKNQLLLIKAVPKVLQRFLKTRFVFVGPIEDSSYFGRISRLIKNGKLDSSVEFTGEFTGNRLFETYKNASIFAFPTLYETQGVVLLEAMAFGLPVVASDIGPIRDVVSLEKDSALLVDPDHVDAIADAIIQLLGDESLKEKLITRGKNLVSSKFSWPQIANRMLGVYKDVIHSQKERKEGS